MFKLSIIIPVYGVEKYIERCALSIFQQTVQDFELIFINDCSKDNSWKILLEVISRYQDTVIQVNVIEHPVNKGISATRETGLKAASGEYILYVDSDDYIAPNMVELLLKRANETDADIVYCDYHELKNHQLTYQNQSLSFSDSQLITASMLRGEIVWAPWNKIFRKAIATTHDIHWPPNVNVGEDLVVMAKLFSHSKKIEHVGEALYIYNRDNVSSYLNSWNSSSCQQNVSAIELLDDYFSHRFENATLVKSLDKIKLTARYQMLYSFDQLLYTQIPNTFPETDKQLFDFIDTSWYWKLAMFLNIKDHHLLLTILTRLILLFKKIWSLIK